MSYGQQPGPGNPYGAPMSYGQNPGFNPAFNPALGQIAKEISSQATASLVVGLISFVCFGIFLGPMAIYRGSKALRLINQYNIGHEEAGKANAGRIIGIISTVLNVIGILFWIAMLVLGAATGGMQQ
jgi:hypothetical protein